MRIGVDLDDTICRTTEIVHKKMDEYASKNNIDVLEVMNHELVREKFFDEYFINARYLENSYGNLWGRFKWYRQKRYVKQAYSIVRNGKCKVYF